jgi:hypothetical protein
MLTANKNRPVKSVRCQLGQSMIEYTVVIVFGILTLSSGPMKVAVNDLLTSIRSNYHGYSYAIAFSDIPDSDTHQNYVTLLDGMQDVPPELKRQLTDSARHPLRYQVGVGIYGGLPNVKALAKQGTKIIKKCIASLLQSCP